MWKQADAIAALLRISHACRMSQMHLFRRAASEPDSLPLDPAFIRKHLTRVLRLLTSADFMPWQPAEARSWIERFPKLAQENLPEDEAAAMISMFECEIARLDKASILRR